MAQSGSAASMLALVLYGNLWFCFRPDFPLYSLSSYAHIRAQAIFMLSVYGFVLFVFEFRWHAVRSSKHRIVTLMNSESRTYSFAAVAFILY